MASEPLESTSKAPAAEVAARCCLRRGAAHIRPVGENGSDHFHNGIPLCPKHHTAFDRFLLIIDPLGRKIIFAKGYTANTPEIYNKKIRHNLSFDDLLYRRILFDETSDSDE